MYVHLTPAVSAIYGPWQLVPRVGTLNAYRMRQCGATAAFPFGAATAATDQLRAALLRPPHLASELAWRSSPAQRYCVCARTHCHWRP